MNPILYQNICNSTAHRPSRDFNANLVFENPGLFGDLLSVALNTEDQFHYKACWILELVLEQRIAWLAPFLDEFCRTLICFKHNGALRSISKISLFASRAHIEKAQAGSFFLSDGQLREITENAFSWIIGEDKVATKAYAIRTLFEIGKMQSWIYPELVPILQQGFPNHSPAYKAVAREILTKITRSTPGILP